MALKRIKGKIRSVEKTHKVTRAMEAVSAVKMRKSQATALAGRPYARAAFSILSRVAGAGEIARHALSRRRSIKNALFLVVTSDKGLAGSLNVALLKEAAAAVKRTELSKEHVSFITLGRKATEHFGKRGYRILACLENIADDVKANDVSFITKRMVEAYLAEECEVAYAVYTNFYSTLVQRPVTRKLLPLEEEELRTLVEGIVPERGRFAELRKEGLPHVPTYTIEPSEEEVLGAVLPLLLNVAVYHALLESKASEHSARMVAMKSASDKAEELTEALTHELNKERQSLITREVSEIIGGIEAMSSH